MKKIRLIFVLAVFLILLAAVNWIYQVVHNPVILLSLFSSGNYKSSTSTWDTYLHLFKRHSTDVMTPEYLGALAQVESAGNPLVIPEWRWRLTTDPFRIYAPASSSAGLYQYTRPTFKDARRFCIHGHEVALAGPLWDLDSCWFNGLYSRLWPSHAIEMTSARLHYYVDRIIRKKGFGEVSLVNKQKLASIIHLCGVSKGRRFAGAGFRFQAVPVCGTHDTAAYYRRIERVMNRYRKMGRGFFR